MLSPPFLAKVVFIYLFLIWVEISSLRNWYCKPEPNLGRWEVTKYKLMCLRRIFRSLYFTWVVIFLTTFYFYSLHFQNGLSTLALRHLREGIISSLWASGIPYLRPTNKSFSRVGSGTEVQMCRRWLKLGLKGRFQTLSNNLQSLQWWPTNINLTGASLYENMWSVFVWAS